MNFLFKFVPLQLRNRNRREREQCGFCPSPQTTVPRATRYILLQILCPSSSATAIMGRCCSCHCHHHFGISHGSWNGREQLQQDLLTGLPLFFLNFKFLSFVLELKRLAFCWYPCTLHPTKNSLFCVAVNIGKEIRRVRKNSHVEGFISLQVLVLSPGPYVVPSLEIDTSCVVSRFLTGKQWESGRCLFHL